MNATDRIPLLRNDVHSGLNATIHARVLAPDSPQAVAGCMEQARAAGTRLAVAGAHHAMGGQQFARDGWLLDTRNLADILGFDHRQGLLRVGAGTRWPALQDFLRQQRDGDGDGWAIAQKQTGADDFSLGGALASNIHGRGLDRPPFVADLEAFTLVLPCGSVRQVDRQREPALFALAVGGYGLFGVVTDLTLRLQRRQRLRRRVQLLRRSELPAAFAQARTAGCGFGDFQFAIDPADRDFLDLGVFAVYEPTVQATTTVPRQLDAGAWRRLMLLAHTDRSRAFREYSDFYLSTDGQCYGSDDHQFGVYLDGYHRDVDRCLGHEGSELITELYVPLPLLDALLGRLAEDCRRHRAELVYGTVRLIRKDSETRLAWARSDFACVVLNLHLRHDSAGISAAAAHMRRFIDHALALGGSFYLTYHRFARADQLRRAYPELDAVLTEKRRLDPAELLASDWYRSICCALGRTEAA